jgi:hypothetical protein
VATRDGRGGSAICKPILLLLTELTLFRLAPRRKTLKRQEKKGCIWAAAKRACTSLVRRPPTATVAPPREGGRSRSTSEPRQRGAVALVRRSIPAALLRAVGHKRGRRLAHLRHEPQPRRKETELISRLRKGKVSLFGVFPMFVPRACLGKKFVFMQKWLKRPLFQRFPMFVSSSSWRNDRRSIKMAPRKAFSAAPQSSPPHVLDSPSSRRRSAGPPGKAPAARHKQHPPTHLIESFRFIPTPC